MNIYDSKTYIDDLKTAILHSIGIKELRKKSILITGATGTIGSFIADMLAQYNKENGAEIKLYVAGRNLDKLKERYNVYEDAMIVPIQYDVTLPIEFDFDMDYIIHAAGNAHPAAFNGNPVETIIGNVIGTYNLLEYAREHGVKRLLYVSSGEVYGQGNLELDEFDETYAGYIDILSTRSCYPSSKRATENLCVSYYKQYGTETVIVRPCHTYGPVITASDNRANAQFIRNALNNEDIVMKSAGKQLRSYNYVSDCASAILTVLVNGVSGEAYNIANPKIRISISELANIIAETVGTKVVYMNPNEKELADRTPISKQVLSSRKISELGWEEAYTIERGIVNTIKILQGK